MEFYLSQYSIEKRGTIDPDAEEFVLDFLQYFLEENRNELITALEEDIEEVAGDLFQKLECWYMTDSKLLNTYKNSVY